MLTISAKGVYGLTAMVELASIADKKPVQIKDISNQYSIPQHYLEQIMILLKKAGLIKSFRGAQGGYSLSGRPEKIKVIDILSTLEGSLQLANQGKKESGISFFWDETEQKIHELLSLDLKSLVDKKMQNSNQIMYYI